MKKLAVVTKIENDVVFIKFSDNKIKRFDINVFIKEPYIDEKVEFQKNGLIVNYEDKYILFTNKFKSVFYIGISYFILSLFYLLHTLYKNTFNDNLLLNSVFAIYSIILLITLLCKIKSAKVKDNYYLTSLLLILIYIPIFLLVIYFILQLLFLIWAFTACLFI